MVRCDLGGAVARAVVDHDHLAGAARALNPLPRVVDDRSDRLFLVEARDEDGDFRPRLHRLLGVLTLAGGRVGPPLRSGSR
jgi:hypothetical protein